MSKKSLSRHPHVKQDIADIFKYISRRNPDAARQVRSAIRESIRSLLDPDWDVSSSWEHRTKTKELKDLRFVLALPYRQFMIFFRRTDQEIRVLYVQRGSRDIEGIHEKESRS